MLCMEGGLNSLVTHLKVAETFCVTEEENKIVSVSKQSICV